MEDEKRKEGEDAGQVHPAGEDWTPDSSIFIQMAESLRLQGRSEEAIETLRKGLEKMPDSLPGRLLLGRCLLEKGLFAEARKELETVARGVEECLPVYKMLSQVYLEEKDVDKALEVLRKTLYFQTAEETAGKKVTPLEMGLLHRGPHPPFVTPPSLVTPPAPQASPAPRAPAGPGAVSTGSGRRKGGQGGHTDRHPGGNLYPARAFGSGPFRVPGNPGKRPGEFGGQGKVRSPEDTRREGERSQGTQKSSGPAGKLAGRGLFSGQARPFMSICADGRSLSP